MMFTSNTMTSSTMQQSSEKQWPIFRGIYVYNDGLTQLVCVPVLSLPISNDIPDHSHDAYEPLFTIMMMKKSRKNFTRHDRQECNTDDIHISTTNPYGLGGCYDCILDRNETLVVFSPGVILDLEPMDGHFNLDLQLNEQNLKRYKSIGHSKFFRTIPCCSMTERPSDFDEPALLGIGTEMIGSNTASQMAQVLPTNVQKRKSPSSNDATDEAPVDWRALLYGMSSLEPSHSHVLENESAVAPYPICQSNHGTSNTFLQPNDLQLQALQPVQLLPPQLEQSYPIVTLRQVTPGTHLPLNEDGPPVILDREGNAMYQIVFQSNQSQSQNSGQFGLTNAVVESVTTHPVEPLHTEVSSAKVAKRSRPRILRARRKNIPCVPVKPIKLASKLSSLEDNCVTIGAERASSSYCVLQHETNVISASETELEDVDLQKRRKTDAIGTTVLPECGLSLEQETDEDKITVDDFHKTSSAGASAVHPGTDKSSVSKEERRAKIEKLKADLREKLNMLENM